MAEKSPLLQKIPSVHEILKHQKLKSLLLDYNRSFVVDVVNDVLGNIRKDIASSQNRRVDLSTGYISSKVCETIDKIMKPSLVRVINATGVILHTGLGRAILDENALESLKEIGGNYCNLEIDAESGKRGRRETHLRNLICTLSNGEDAFVVNNNAAGVMLSLNTLALGREVIVARGELVEIGGSFRMPEIMKKSGCKLVEVGTTNRVTVDDYRRAAGENTALLLKVHTSNYRIVGFSKDVSLKELVKLGDDLNLPVMYDVGSGALLPEIKKEPLIGESVATGVSIISFSADKLLGGPQGGIIIGKKHYIEEMRKNPFARAVRIGKLTIAALESTLKGYLTRERLNPTLQMLSRPLDDIHNDAVHLAKHLKATLKGSFEVEVIDGYSKSGGGALPLEELPTKLVAIKPIKGFVEKLAKSLRLSAPSVIGRIANNRLLLDLRTVKKDAIEEIVETFKKIAKS